jgi:hypothetical protein
VSASVSRKLGFCFVDFGRNIVHSHKRKFSCMWLNMSLYLNSLTWLLSCLDFRCLCCPEIESSSVDWAQQSRFYTIGRGQSEVSETSFQIKLGPRMEPKQFIAVLIYHCHKMFELIMANYFQRYHTGNRTEEIVNFSKLICHLRDTLCLVLLWVFSLSPDIFWFNSLKYVGFGSVEIHPNWLLTWWTYITSEVGVT